MCIGIVGKYLAIGDYNLADSYVSIYQALVHAGAELGIGISIEWIDAQAVERGEQQVATLQQCSGVIIPGGFGNTGVEGKIKAIEFVRSNKIPFLGICYGMQLAAVEFARNVCGMQDAHTTEVDPKTSHPIIDILPLQKQLLAQQAVGGSMRLGAYKATVKKGSKVARLYDRAGLFTESDQTISERHRHRYEVNPKFIPELESKGLQFSGHYQREDGTKLMEFLELSEHPFFVATQAHPEFTSRLGNANPLFLGLVEASKEYAASKSVFSHAKKKNVSEIQKSLKTS